MRKLVNSEIKETKDGKHYIVSNYHEQDSDDHVIFRTTVRSANYLNEEVLVAAATKEIINKINLNSKGVAK